MGPVFVHEITANVPGTEPLTDILPSDAAIIGVIVRGGNTTVAAFRLRVEDDVSISVIDAPSGSGIRLWWASSQKNITSEVSNALPPGMPEGVPLKWIKDNDGSEQILSYQFSIGDGASSYAKILYHRPTAGVST